MVGIADRLAVEPEAGAAVHARERQELNGARGLHARHGLDTLENPVHDADPVLRVAVAEEEAHRDRVGGLESETNTRQAREGPQQQPGANEQHDGQRHLRYHKRAAEPVMTRGPRCRHAFARRARPADRRDWPATPA